MQQMFAYRFSTFFHMVFDPRECAKHRQFIFRCTVYSFFQIMLYGGIKGGI